MKKLELLEIRREIEEFKAEYGAQWGVKYFKNFIGDLPGGYKRKWGEDTLAKEYSIRGGRRFGQSRKQFHIEIDKTIEKLFKDIGIKQFEQAQERAKELKGEDCGFWNLVADVYLELLSMEYQQEELVDI